jgi:hypothetical protein
VSKLELNGHIDEHGKFTITNRLRLQEWCRLNKGKNVVVTIKRKGSQRSTQQNRYYFGVVIKEIGIRLRDLGHPHLEDEAIHEMMKIKFNFEQMVNDKTGEVLEIPKTTTDLNKTEFGEYIDRVRMWAAEFLDIDIPDPNTDLKMQF